MQSPVTFYGRGHAPAVGVDCGVGVVVEGGRVHAALDSGHAPLERRGGLVIVEHATVARPRHHAHAQPGHSHREALIAWRVPVHPCVAFGPQRAARHPRNAGAVIFARLGVVVERVAAGTPAQYVPAPRAGLEGARVIVERGRHHAADMLRFEGLHARLMRQVGDGKSDRIKVVGRSSSAGR